jgi:ribokinase
VLTERYVGDVGHSNWQGSVDLVIVGHLGLNEDETPFGRAVSLGGAGYAVAKGAGLLGPRRVGLVSIVGPDVHPEIVRRLGIDLEGVTLQKGRSPRWYIRQHQDGRRTFSAEMSTAEIIAPVRFPLRYESATHVHLATAPPEQQLVWLSFLRTIERRPTVSVDMFEHFARDEGDLCRRVCEQADLIFMNAEERRILFDRRALPDVPAVVKFGPLGACYQRSGGACWVGTIPEKAVDTTGAGEVLAGVFLALRLAGDSPRTALTEAVRAATAKVTQFGVDGHHLARVLRQIQHAAVRRHEELKHPGPLSS